MRRNLAPGCISSDVKLCQKKPLFLFFRGPAGNVALHQDSGVNEKEQAEDWDEAALRGNEETASGADHPRRPGGHKPNGALDTLFIQGRRPVFVCFCRLFGLHPFAP